MEKPLSIQIEEFRSKLISIINDTKLHPYILDSVVADVYNNVHIQYQQLLQKEITDYNNSVKENNKETEGESSEN